MPVNNPSLPIRTVRFDNGASLKGVYCLASPNANYKQSGLSSSSDPFATRDNKYFEARVVRIATRSKGVHVKMSAAGTAATTNDLLIPAESVEYIAIDTNYLYLRLIEAAASANATVTEVGRLTEPVVSYSNTKSWTWEGFYNSEYGDVGTSSLLNFGRGDEFTLMVWLQTNSANANNKYFIGRDGSNSGYSLRMLSDGTCRAYLGASGINQMQVDTLSSIKHATNWFHVAMVYDGSGAANGITWYVNGEDDTNGTPNLDNSTVDWAGSRNFYLNGNGGAGNYWVGQMDEPAVFDYALSQAQVQQAYGSGVTADLSGLNPVAWWRMGDDASDDSTADTGQITDQSGNALHATPKNTDGDEITINVPS